MPFSLARPRRSGIKPARVAGAFSKAGAYGKTGTMGLAAGAGRAKMLGFPGAKAYTTSRNTDGNWGMAAQWAIEGAGIGRNGQIETMGLAMGAGRAKMPGFSGKKAYTNSRNTDGNWRAAPMGDRGYEHRKKWNSENYKQLNVAISAGLAEAFKSACEANGEPARQAVIRLITGYIPNAQPKKRTPAHPDYSTKAKRKKAATEVLGQLEAMRDAEEEYRGNIPENMYNKQEEAERTVGIYEDAISAVEELYSK